MIQNIKILCEREINILTRKRIFIFVFAIIGVLFSIFTLIYINRIINLATSESIFNYEDLAFLHDRLVDALYIVSIFSSVFFLSSSINNDRNNNTLDNILSTNANMKEVTIAKFIVGYYSVFSIDIFIIPIIMFSLFYGGMSITRFLLYFILILFVSLFISALSLFFSYIFKDNMKSIFASIIFAILFSIFYIAFRRIIILKAAFFISIILLNILLAFIILTLIIKGKK